MDLTAKVVDVHLHLVEARRRHGEAQQPVHPDHAAQARGKREGIEQGAPANEVGLGALADLTRPHVSVDVARLPRSVGEPADESSVLWRQKCPPNGMAWHSCRTRAISPPQQAHTAGPLRPALGGRASRSE